MEIKELLIPSSQIIAELQKTYTNFFRNANKKFLNGLKIWLRDQIHQVFRREIIIRIKNHTEEDTVVMVVEEEVSRQIIILTQEKITLLKIKKLDSLRLSLAL